MGGGVVVEEFRKSCGVRGLGGHDWLTVYHI